ncbi:unnamed protein product [Phaedon cochleariae]|uniref:PHD-type domain-containing protein n=1 Tax=Phaedon cochleariae TaxID=80249 RepID=A0A9N9SJ94_PHACE|nr:unnamed protein product [Phaedon cochleariae]
MSSYNRCLGCKKEALEDRTTFKCDGCKRLIHITCAGVTATEVKCLQLSSRKMKYFCDDCEEGLLQVPILRKLLEESQIEVEKLKKTNMVGLQDKQQEVDKLRKEVKELREHGDFGNVESMFEEINELLNRANDLMIYNVPESRSRDLKSRIDDDKEKVRETMQILDIRDAESNILKVLRVGRSDGSRAKPLKVVFSNSYLVREMLKSKQKLQQSNFRISAAQTKLQQEIFKKNNILSNCGKLRGSNIAISNDLTPNEREEQRILRKYLNQEKKSGKFTSCYIRKNKLHLDDNVYTIEELKEIEEEEEARRVLSEPSTPTQRLITKVRSEPEEKVERAG